MEDKTNTTQQQQPGEPTAFQQQSAEFDAADADKTKKTIPYARFKEIDDKYVALKAQFAELQKKQSDAEAETLKQQNKYKELYEQRESELKAERLNNMRLRVGKGLPEEIAELLRGETEDELRAHAEKLSALFTAQQKEPEAPKQYGIPPLKTGGAAQIDLTKETDPEKIREYVKSLKRQ